LLITSAPSNGAGCGCRAMQSLVRSPTWALARVFAEKLPWFVGRGFS
jgi:hypothetical protein